jgi:hypothetical protein
MVELSKKEIEILSVFEDGFSIERGYDFLLKRGLNKKEIDELIEKLKKEEYLDEFDTPVGRMLCTLYSKISIDQLDKLKRGLAEH